MPRLFFFFHIPVDLQRHKVISVPELEFISGFCSLVIQQHPGYISGDS
jgi:hypothetical protein